jgi:3-oxoacyl-[acyl-carrier-protein] synthase-3
VTFATILGAGEYRPARVRRNDFWPSDFGAGRPHVLTEITRAQGDPCAEIVQRHLQSELGDPFMGTRERRVADDTLSSHEAQALAARAALDDAGLEPNEIDYVLSYALTPERPAMACAPWIVGSLGMERAVGVGLDAACGSLIAQLVFASSLIQSGLARKVLLTQAHLAARIMPAEHPASPNLGDLATAVVVGASDRPGILVHEAATQAEYADAVVWARRHGGVEPRWWEPGGRFQLGTLDHARAQELVARTVHIARDTMLSACRRAEVAPDEVSLLCSVQPRAWIPKAIAEAADFKNAQAPSTFSELAHVGACGPVANLLQGRREGLLNPGTLVGLYAQGAGFTRLALLFRWTGRNQTC